MYPIIKRTLSFAVIMTLLISLFGFIALGSQTRHLQDDYCYGERVRNEGFFAAQYSSYFGSVAYPGNRYAATLFSGLGEVLPINTYPSFAYFSIAAFCLGMALLVSNLASTFQLNASTREVIITAAAICFMSLYIAPNRYQTLYFRSSSLTYFFAVIFNVWIGNLFFLYLRKGKAIHLIALAFTTLIAAGFGEVGVAIQLCMWAFLLIVFLIRNKDKKAIRAALLIIFFSAAGLALLLLCPNNSERQSNFGPPNTMGALIKDGPLLGFDFIFYTIRGNFIPIIITLCLGFYSALKSKSPFGNSKQTVLFMAITAAVGYGLIVAGILPSLYAYRAYPDGRGLTEAIFILVVVIFLLGLCIGWLGRKFTHRSAHFAEILAVLLLACFWAYFTHAGVSVYQEYAKYHQRAKEWDSRYEFILQQIDKGEKELIVPAIDSISETAELQADAGHWVNECAALYFGVDSISAVE